LKNNMKHNLQNACRQPREAGRFAAKSRRHQKCKLSMEGQF
jgi:hypothetical protein